jgi:hypothetical protein
LVKTVDVDPVVVEKLSKRRTLFNQCLNESKFAWKKMELSPDIDQKTGALYKTFEKKRRSREINKTF